MQKVLGILTEDFRLYHDLVAALKARDLPFVSLSFARRPPEAVGAVLTSPNEASRARGRNIVPVDDIEGAIDRALQLLKGKTEWRQLAVGIDPGREPGIAVVGDGDVLETRVATSPEAVADHVRRALRTFPAKDARVRVGHGDPTNRNRILNSLADDGLRVEIVDEAGTTRRSPQPDVDAAIDIALTPGVRVRPPFEIRPTRGELREIQRRSRLHSDGEVTISVALAESVARGEISLQDAVAHQRRRDRSSED
ncbi:MAG: hypothetical protein A3K68_03395 [Euryarchaeota archaeon RBG_16_68_13]|nr:MAG: hypothetical protein A3K68_03395 [Euryarchaeota archaeon RBG_16_68_13]